MRVRYCKLKQRKEKNKINNQATIKQKQRKEQRSGRQKDKETDIEKRGVEREDK